MIKAKTTKAVDCVICSLVVNACQERNDFQLRSLFLFQLPFLQCSFPPASSIQLSVQLGRGHQAIYRSGNRRRNQKTYRAVAMTMWSSLVRCPSQQLSNAPILCHSYMLNESIFFNFRLEEKRWRNRMSSRPEEYIEKRGLVVWTNTTENSLLTK